MSRKDIERIISENIDSGFFTGGAEESILGEIENRLDVTLPDGYKWFLRKYGSGGIFGVDILGVGRFNEPIVIDETMKLRKFGLEKNLVVIEDCDEFVYCLDTSEMINNECPVISWDQHDGYDSIEAKTFTDFLTERFADAKEAWEED
ncbi:SMI1/KNR4 family protein [Virgibacillus dakarensis]|uniref:SMI1/KNR4 family protein n=1 Tax=Virgibacillus dakarensis TaxID=1917889 RepID=UPI000B44F930|nr:SMI1/KNR4 family protein [Virgibacillus dakarensis]MBT2214623.1 SMI1/KNR4 family protein [Virgibacillus dakarensis]MTW87350.1 SMI1/KNR4 family protein [Virgibacillus dakarensis]